MLNLRQIAHASLLSTSRYPRWWILALVQVIGFSSVGGLLRPRWMRTVFASWLFLAVVMLVLATVWLWQDILANKLQRLNQLSVKVFIKHCLTAGAITLCSMGVIIAIRLLYLHWTFLAVISSLVAATATLAMLYAVLCGQTFFRAWALAMDTWNKKISLAAAVALMLILAHGVSYALVHEIRLSFGLAGEFSVLGQSATIWILLFAAIALVSFLAAVLNCFLVLLFLEIIQLKKAPEAEKQAVAQLAVSEANP